MTEPNARPQADESRSVIAAFEQILETFPEDTVTRDALAQAYEDVGETDSARRHLVALAQMFMDSGDLDRGFALRDRFLRLGPADSDTMELFARMEESARTAGKTGEEDAATLLKGSGAREGTAAILDAEIDLAHSLRDAGLFNPEEHAEVVRDLQTLALSAAELTISVLHVLHDRGARSLQSVLLYLSREYRLPILPVHAIEPMETNFGKIPMEYGVRRGVGVYDSIGREFMVAIMNPRDPRLRKEVRLRCGSECHFCLVTPADFDAWVRRVREMAR